MTRWQSWLTEAQPQVYVEISKELAELRGIKNGDKVRVESPRGKVECVAMVTTAVPSFQRRRTDDPSGGDDLQLRLALPQGLRRHGQPADPDGR